MLPASKGRFSDEIWREIALWLPRRDLKTLLFVPNALSRVASQLLFRRLDLHLSVPPDHDELAVSSAAYAQRTADILTRVIVDPSFGGFVRTLCIYSYATGKDESMAFQMGECLCGSAVKVLRRTRDVGKRTYKDGEPAKCVHFRLIREHSPIAPGAPTRPYTRAFPEVNKLFLPIHRCLYSC